MNNRTVSRFIGISGLSFSFTILFGCHYDPHWSQARIETRDGQTVRVYKVDGAKTPNYFQRMEADGRISVLQFDDNGDGRIDETVDRRTLGADVPHCFLVLDGVAYDIVADMWKAGHFRLFPPPSRVISVFPAMTDLALTRIFQSPPCVGYEALYFDRSANQLAGGNMAYLRGDNAPWLPAVSYHAPQNIGARAYLSPQSVFDEEMRGTFEAFRRAKTGCVTAYSIGTAGLGTCGGRAAMEKYLLTVEQMFERLVYEKRGRVHLSLTADHGHNLKPLTRTTFKKTLGDAGYRLSDSIRDSRDVVTPEYGLVTDAVFFTREPQKVAAVLLKDPAVELAAYRRGNAIVVSTRGAEAEVSQRGGGFAYQMTHGDPLQLGSIISSLRAAGKVSADGTIDDRALFDATTTHHYPDPLHRLWDGFHSLVQKPADLIVSLHDTYCHGWWLFEFAIHRAASTHGALDLMSSTSFVLSDVGPLPTAMRIDGLFNTLENVRRGGAATANSRHSN